MPKSESRSPLADPITAPITFETVMAMAEDTEVYLNETKGISDKETLGLIHRLDTAAGSVYMMQGVNVSLSGIYESNRFREGSPFDPITRLKSGLIKGRSYGFSAQRLEMFKPDPFRRKYEHDLYDEMIERAVGDIAICHIVTPHDAKFSRAVVANRYAVTGNLYYHAIAPILSSTLFTGIEAYDPLASGYKKTETKKILETLDRSSMAILEDLEIELYAERDILANLSAAAPYARRLFEKNNHAIVAAVRDHISHICDQAILEHEYSFDELPPCLILAPDGSQLAVRISGQRLIAFSGISAQPHYYVNDRSEAVLAKREKLGLYADATTVMNARGKVFNFSVPLEHIKPGSYQELLTIK
jgi:hypothetical protein